MWAHCCHWTWTFQYEIWTCLSWSATHRPTSRNLSHTACTLMIENIVSAGASHTFIRLLGWSPNYWVRKFYLFNIGWVMLARAWFLIFFFSDKWVFSGLLTDFTAFDCRVVNFLGRVVIRARIFILRFVMFTLETHVTLSNPTIDRIVGSWCWHDLLVIEKYLITTLVSNLSDCALRPANKSRVVGSWSWSLAHFLLGRFSIANCGSTPRFTRWDRGVVWTGSRCF